MPVPSYPWLHVPRIFINNTLRGGRKKPLYMNPILLIVFPLYGILCYSTADYHCRKRKVDVDLGTVICIILTPLIGGFILVCLPERDRNLGSVTKSKPEDKPLPSPSAKHCPQFIAKTKTQPINPKKAIKPFVWNKGILKIISMILLGVLVIMILMNPGYDSFKEYTPARSTTKHHALRKRLNNFLIFSLYEVNYTDWDEYSEDYKSSSKRYLGILKNFYEKK